MSARSWIVGAVPLCFVLGCGEPSQEATVPVTDRPQEGTRSKAADAFPAGAYGNLNPIGPRTIDLGASLGVRPTILYYWIAGHSRSEAVFRDLEQLVAGIAPDRVALYGVAVPRDDLVTAEAIRNRLQLLGLSTAVLEDTGFTIGKWVGAKTVPYISIVDREGRLRLTNGASLAQEVGGGLTLADVIRRTAETGTIDSHGALGRYYPVKELEGQPSPDFTASLLANDGERSWSTLVDGEKLNVLVFWTVDCGHCREELPEINSWLRGNPDVNLVSCARALDHATRTKTLHFSQQHDFVFPTLVDDDSSISDLYRVTSTPTILIIRPDGVIDTVIVSHDEGPSFAEAIERKKAELLGNS